MRKHCRTLLASIWVWLVQAQVRILAPESLAKKFPDTHGIVYGTTATFGAPYYGERVLGQLLYGKSRGGQHCKAEDYDLPVPKNRTAPGQELVNVVLVQRGGCTFVTKVKVAEDKHAHAVIVVDRVDSTMTSEEIQHIVMADDGWGSSVRIPSVLVSRYDGQKLIDASKQGTVIVELAWDIPRGEVVVADFWMSSGSRESSEFLQRFKDSAELLRYRLQFVPHYHVFSLPAGNSFGQLCTDESSKYCAPDPDGPGPVTGADVVSEDLRQLCIWNTTARTADGSPRGATHSREFWEYVVQLARSCPFKESDPASRFGERCSRQVMADVGIPKDEVERCELLNREQFLDDQINNVAWSPQALRLNGWRYAGPLDPETVLKAVCSGYASAPKECDELLTGYTGPIRWPTSTVTFSVFAWTIFLLALFLAVLFYMYRRHVTSSVRKVLREEVMLEVHTMMADYVPMQDGGGRPGENRVLSF